MVRLIEGTVKILELHWSEYDILEFYMGSHNK